MDRGFLEDQNDIKIAMVTCNVFLLEGFLFAAFRAMATFCKMLLKCVKFGLYRLLRSGFFLFNFCCLYELRYL